MSTESATYAPADPAEPVPGDPADGAVPTPGGGRPRLRGAQSVRNMVLSLAVICGAVFGLILLNPDDQPEGEVPTVEYEVAAATAARAAPYPVLVPEGLPGGWRATSVRYDPAGEYGPTWRLGFLDPGDQYAALTQAEAGEEAVAGEFVSSVTRGAEDTGETLAVGGRDWARYEGPKYDALVLREDGATTVVMGTASFDGLAAFAGALTPAGG
ncbi:DUF4245 domain-containing protein [Streptomyces sp. DSM 44917]|uniref:DUF4245 domain-containing protein n=1 Tax=Streptomyces boetiae TaxID=3075541 RepID=A0ABU2L867_9ACTN|nr:DUF4245 domain-containing protein [Streptomyces sp. DSM 44917]MDT0307757.1 DUF4245 domain-containing protein [Streptomyces sp. DSM 44917]